MIYLTGVWTNLQVWKDGNGDYYVKVPNGGRNYLTGAAKGLVAYEGS